MRLEGSRLHAVVVDAGSPGAGARPARYVFDQGFDAATQAPEEVMMVTNSLLQLPHLLLRTRVSCLVCPASV